MPTCFAFGNDTTLDESADILSEANYYFNSSLNNDGDGSQTNPYNTLTSGSIDKPYHLNMLRAGRYTMAFSFGGNDNYNSTFAVVCIDLDKKPITIKAIAKTYKATAKTKKYTVTLKTIAGSSLDGKTYLSKGKEVTLTIKDKTYTGKTNDKGQVTFKLKLTKKGKYTAKISYEGDDIRKINKKRKNNN